MRLLLLVLALSSCALAGGAGAPATLSAPASEVWQGHYTCAGQGETGARLELLSWQSNVLTLRAQMFPVASNPSVPRGEAEVKVEVEGHHFKLLGYRWISQPAGYVVPPLSGKWQEQGRTLTLKLDPNIGGCTSAELERGQ